MTGGRFSVDDLARLTPHWDRAVDRTPDVDGFCSSSLWSFSAATSFPEAGAPVIVGDGEAFGGLRPVSTPDGGRALVGLDPVWGFASPLVGPPIAAAQRLADRLRLEPFDYAVVTAQREDSVLTAAVAHVLDADFRLMRGPVQERLRIDLSGGTAEWWARRSPRFRQRMRRLRDEAGSQAVWFEDVSAMDPDALFERVLAIEAGSWKGRDGTGLAAADLAAFYRQMATRLAGCDQLRALVARRDDADVGYILGGVRGRTYRGLQLSYVEAARDLGIGHLLQWEQLERLALEGSTVYDLGMDMAYKRRWADRVDETIAIIVIR